MQIHTQHSAVVQ